MKQINLACGKRYHQDWVNVDFSPNKKVKKVNLLKRLPYLDNAYGVAYNSHFLEHLSPDQAKNFLKEIKRILKKKGILRIVVPDLENICREYIKLLNNNSKEYKKEWIYIELMDQMVRTYPGGNMLKIYNSVTKSKNKKLSKYILERVGVDLLSKNQQVKQNFLERITFGKIVNQILIIYFKFVRLLIPKSLRNEIFIQTSIGERHKWMYDKYSLTKLLDEVGFKNITVKKFNESKILNFNEYLLDMNSDGTPYKGVSSLYVECEK